MGCSSVILRNFNANRCWRLTRYFTQMAQKAVLENPFGAFTTHDSTSSVFADCGPYNSTFRKFDACYRQRNAKSCWRVYELGKQNCDIGFFHMLLRLCEQRSDFLALLAKDPNSSIELPFSKKVLVSRRLQFLAVLWRDFDNLYHTQSAFIDMFLPQVIRAVDPVPENERHLLRELKMFANCLKPGQASKRTLPALLLLYGTMGHYKLLENTILAYLNLVSSKKKSKSVTDAEIRAILDGYKVDTTSLELSNICIALEFAIRSGRRSFARQIFTETARLKLSKPEIDGLFHFYLQKNMSFRVEPDYAMYFDLLQQCYESAGCLKEFSSAVFKAPFELALSRGALEQLYGIYFASIQMKRPLTGSWRQNLQSFVYQYRSASRISAKKFMFMFGGGARLPFQVCVDITMHMELSSGAVERILQLYAAHRILPDLILVKRILAFVDASNVTQVVSLIKQSILFFADASATDEPAIESPLQLLEQKLQRWPQKRFISIRRAELLTVVLQHLNVFIQGSCLRQCNDGSLVLDSGVYEKLHELVPIVELLAGSAPLVQEKDLRFLWSQCVAFLVLMGCSQTALRHLPTSLDKQRAFWHSTKLLNDFSPTGIRSLMGITVANDAPHELQTGAALKLAKLVDSVMGKSQSQLCRGLWHAIAVNISLGEFGPACKYYRLLLDNFACEDTAVLRSFPALVFYLSYTGICLERRFFDFAKYRLRLRVETSKHTTRNKLLWSNDWFDTFELMIKETEPFAVPSAFWSDMVDLLRFSPSAAFLEVKEAERVAAIAQVYGLYERHVVSSSQTGEADSQELAAIARQLHLPIVERTRREFAPIMLSSVLLAQDKDPLRSVLHVLANSTCSKDNGAFGVACFEKYVSLLRRVPSTQCLLYASVLYMQAHEMDMALLLLSIAQTQIEEAGAIVEQSEMFSKAVGLLFRAFFSHTDVVSEESFAMVGSCVPQSVLYKPELRFVAHKLCFLGFRERGLQLAQDAFQASAYAGSLFYVCALDGIDAYVKRKALSPAKCKSMLPLSLLDSISALCGERPHEVDGSIYAALTRAYVVNLQSTYACSTGDPGNVMEELADEPRLGEELAIADSGLETRELDRVERTLRSFAQYVTGESRSEFYQALVSFYIRCMFSSKRAMVELARSEKRQAVAETHELWNAQRNFIDLLSETDFKACLAVYKQYRASAVLPSDGVAHGNGDLAADIFSRMASGLFMQAVQRRAGPYSVAETCAMLWNDFSLLAIKGRREFFIYMMGLAALEGSKLLLSEVYRIAGRRKDFFVSDRNMKRDSTVGDVVMLGFSSSSGSVALAERWFHELVSADKSRASVASLGSLMSVYAKADMEKKMWSVLEELFPRYGLPVSDDAVVPLARYYIRKADYVALQERVFPLVEEGKIAMESDALHIVLPALVKAGNLKVLRAWVDAIERNATCSSSENIEFRAYMYHCCRLLDESKRQKQHLNQLYDMFLQYKQSSHLIALVKVAMSLGDIDGAHEWIEYFTSQVPDSALSYAKDIISPQKSVHTD